MAVSVEKVHFKNGTNSLLSDLVELTKPNLSLLVVVTSLVGLILAPTHINFFQGLLALILIGLVVIGATSLNCYLEKDIDALMERTKMRALPTGRMSTSTAVAFGVICSFVGVVGLFVWINTATALLAALASLLYLFAYTPMKLKSDMALYVGAIPGAIPPVMGWTAATGSFGPMAWVLFLVLFVWQLPHFMAISIYHADDYQRANIKVLPNLRGKAFAKWGILLLTMLLFVISLAPVKWGNVAPAYVWSSCLLGGLLTLTASLGLFIKNNSERESSWAKNYFLATVIYLPLQLGAMLFLH
jgi:protoheme IX farnesyltransferase